MDVNSDQHRGLGTDGVTVDSQIQEINENECTDQSDIIFGNDKVKRNEFKRQRENKTSKRRAAYRCSGSTNRAAAPSQWLASRMHSDEACSPVTRKTSLRVKGRLA